MSVPPSKKKFNPEKDLQDLTGKVAFVTGGNRGIGYFTVKHLARKGATVYLGSRSEEAGKAAVAQLEQEGIGSGKVIYAWCDISTPESAQKTGEGVLGQVERLDIYVMNAAMLADFRMKHPDEILAVNHFGNLKLLQTLLPKIQETSEQHGETRIVTVSSMAHKLSRAKNPNIEFKSADDFRHDFSSDGKFGTSFAYYAVSKLCQLMTHIGFHHRHQSNPNMIFVAVDPGEVNTWSHILPITRFFTPAINLFFDSPEVGSYNLLFAAASPLVGEQRDVYNGAFLVPLGKVTPIGTNVTAQKAEDLLETSEKFFSLPNMFPLVRRSS